MVFGNIVLPWTRHVRAGRDLLRRAFEAANKIGDLTYAAYCCNELTTNLLAAGDPLAEVEREAEHGLAFAQKARFGLVVDCIATQLALIRTLRGLTPTFRLLRRCAVSTSAGFERHLAENPVWRLPSAGTGSASCRRASSPAIMRRPSRPRREGATAALDIAIATSKRPNITSTARCPAPPLCDAAPADGAASMSDALAAHHRQLQLWADNCPDNFENRAALVGAEIARIDGRELDAMRLYEQAIRSARANGFVHNEALAYELAARFYAARGFEKFAHVYLRNARYGYLRWGADGKVRQLDQLYPHLRQDERAPGPAGTIGAPVEHLDLATVMKVSQAVSGEIVLEKLLDTLMRTAIEQAGAERGLLILPRGAEQRIEAEATTSGDTVVVHLRDEAVAGAALPESVLHYVLRTREGVILDDAAAENAFSADPYIRQHGARSILCLPLLNQAKLIGVLYLENNLAPRVFAPARIAVLKLLASQAAISLENTRLYRDLAAARSQDPPPGRCQHHRDLHPGSRRARFSRPMTRFSTWSDTTARIWSRAASVGRT